MTIRNILVSIGGAESDRNALDAALALARPFDGHIDGLYVRPDPQTYLRGTYGSAVALRFAEFSKHIARDIDERAEAAKGRFDEWVAAAQVTLCDGPPAPRSPSVSWMEAVGAQAQEVAGRGGVYDLVVAGRPEGDMEEVMREAVEAALFQTGRPMLLAPSPTANEIGKTVFVGWNRSAQAARALAAAMPIVTRAARVVLFMVATGVKEGPGLDEVARSLAWHGIEATINEVEPDRRSVGDRLLDEAADAGADLLVMGAYSHSRWREHMIGGVTRHILDHATMPVLMSH